MACGETVLIYIQKVYTKKVVIVIGKKLNRYLTAICSSSPPYYEMLTANADIFRNIRVEIKDPENRQTTYCGNFKTNTSHLANNSKYLRCGKKERI